MRESALHYLIFLIYFFNNYANLRAQSPFDLPCLDPRISSAGVQNIEELTKLRKFFCISQCMGGFGGEVNFCKTDGICPAEQGGYDPPISGPIITQNPAGKVAPLKQQGAISTPKPKTG